MVLIGGGSRKMIVVAALGGGALLGAGCATSQNAETVPLPAYAHSVWTAYWSAVDRGDVADFNRIAHSSVPKDDETGFGRRAPTAARSCLKPRRRQSASLTGRCDPATSR